MTKQEFADIIFRLEELLMEADFWRQKIGNCGGACRASGEEDHMDLCSSCSTAIREELEAIDALAGNGEFNELMKKVKEAVEGDKTGELKWMLDMARRPTVH